MKYAAAVIALGVVAQASLAAAQEVLVPTPEVTYYAPSVPVTTYYAPSEPVVTYYGPAPVVRTYYPTYAPVVRAYYPAPYYYVPPRVARRWYRNGFYW